MSHNSTIKPKIGKCCESDCSYNGQIMAGRCPTHYQRHRAKVNAEKAARKGKSKDTTPAKSAKDVQENVLGTYFANQAHTMPKYCEESGELLPTFPAWLKLSCMAHILPKRKDFGFESVALHPMNMVFVMPDIHANMDNLGKEFIIKMKIYPILKERVKVLFPLLTEREKNKVPDYLL